MVHLELQVEYKRTLQQFTGQSHECKPNNSHCITPLLHCSVHTPQAVVLPSHIPSLPVVYDGLPCCLQGTHMTVTGNMSQHMSAWVCHQMLQQVRVLDGTINVQGHMCPGPLQAGRSVCSYLCNVVSTRHPNALHCGWAVQGEVRGSPTVPPADSDITLCHVTSCDIMHHVRHTHLEATSSSSRYNMLLQSEHALPLGEATCGGWGGVRRGCTHCKHSRQWDYRIQCTAGRSQSTACD